MLSVRDLSLERHFEPVFQPLSFELTGGQLLVITGTNGSGKTTLLRLLAGLMDPSLGSMERTSRRTQYLGHDAAVKAELSVTENVRFFARLAGTGDRIDSAIQRLGLSGCASQPGRTLSAGQRKRTALARLFTSDADLWLLDEPYTNLDTKGVELVDALLDHHLTEGGACVLATHGGHRPAAREGQWSLVEINLDALPRAV